LTRLAKGKKAKKSLLMAISTSKRTREKPYSLKRDKPKNERVERLLIIKPARKQRKILINPATRMVRMKIPNHAIHKPLQIEVLVKKKLNRERKIRFNRFSNQSKKLKIKIKSLSLKMAIQFNPPNN